MNKKDKKCPKCGSTNNSFQNIFCGRCGAELPKLKFCPECYYASHINEFCTKCGTKLEEFNIILNPENLREEVHALMDEGKYDAAIMYCDVALYSPDDFKNDFEISNIYCLKSEIYTETGKYQLAFKYCEKACEADPTYHFAYDSKAYLLMELGRYDAAIECCDKSFELHEDFYPWYVKGEIYYARKQYAKAMEACKKAEEYETEYPHLKRLIKDIEKAR